MKATPSKDGAFRFSINVKFRAGAEEIVTAICSLLPKSDHVKINRKTVLFECKQLFEDCGEDMWARQDNATDAEQLLAVELAKKLFPELYLP